MFARIVFTSAVLTVPLFSQYAQMEFPLQVGDRWQFSEVQGPPGVEESRVISEAIMANGLKYAVIAGSMAAGNYRKEGSKVYQWISSADRLICDFSKKPGDTLAVYPNGPDSTMVVVMDQGLWMCFDQLRFQMRFKHVSYRSPGHIRAIYHVADSVGFVRLDQETVHFWLVGAVINSRQFGLVTSIAKAQSDMPTGAQLLQNYPNPFNATTMISFRINVASEVSIRIHDLMGRKIALVLSRHLLAGSYSLNWDASLCPSGVYFCNLVAGSTVKTTTMILLK
ncbi:MAG: T9SS type A sorting domain-containing protein [bacterium]